MAAFFVRHQAGCRAEPDDAVEGGGIAQGPAGVRTGAQRHHAGGQRHGRATGGAGGGFARVERIAGDAIDGIARVGAGAEFRRVGFAQHNRAGRLHAGDDALIGGGDIVAKDRAAKGGAQPGGVLQILHAEGQAVQRAEFLAFCYCLIGLFRARAGTGVIARDHGVDGVVDRLDAGDAAFQKFAGGEFFQADEFARINGVEVAGFGHE